MLCNRNVWWDICFQQTSSSNIQSTFISSLSSSQSATFGWFMVWLFFTDFHHSPLAQFNQYREKGWFFWFYFFVRTALVNTFRNIGNTRISIHSFIFLQIHQHQFFLSFSFLFPDKKLFWNGIFAYCTQCGFSNVKKQKEKCFFFCRTEVLNENLYLNDRRKNENKMQANGTYKNMRLLFCSLVLRQTITL